MLIDYSQDSEAYSYSFASEYRPFFHMLNQNCSYPLEEESFSEEIFLRDPFSKPSFCKSEEGRSEISFPSPDNREFQEAQKFFEELQKIETEKEQILPEIEKKTENLIFTPRKGKVNKSVFEASISNKNLKKASETMTYKERIIQEGEFGSRRRYKPDDIRKKVKVHFHKTIRKLINHRLKKAGSEKFFVALSQGFISNISKEINQFALNKTWNELFKYQFNTKKKTDVQKYQLNQDTLNYLRDNPEIMKKSGYDKIGSTSYLELFKEYLRSEEYLKSLEKVRLQAKSFYAERYVDLSKEYLTYFLGKSQKEKKEK